MRRPIDLRHVHCRRGLIHDERDRGPGRLRIAGVIGRVRRDGVGTVAATGRAELLHIPPTAALFGPPVGLDSLTGTLLLREIQRQFGVDVAGEDLNLDSLATLGTLAAFVAARARPGDGP